MPPSIFLAPIRWFWRPKLFLALFLVIALVYLLVTFTYSYSDGYRSGYIQKLSHKGWVCKTHEGELAMTTIPGTAPVLWTFSVWDEKIATELTHVMGQRLVLHYKEYRHLPTTCFGETPYFVDRVEVQE